MTATLLSLAFYVNNPLASVQANDCQHLSNFDGYSSISELYSALPSFPLLLSSSTILEDSVYTSVWG